MRARARLALRHLRQHAVVEVIDGIEAFDHALIVRDRDHRRAAVARDAAPGAPGAREVLSVPLVLRMLGP